MQGHRPNAREGHEVNRLVKALLAHPDVVDEAVPHGRADFEFLRHQLGDELMSEQEWAALPSRPEIGPSLRSGYLPVITATDWVQALQEAQEGPDEPGWRTVMVRNSNGESGSPRRRTLRTSRSWLSSPVLPTTPRPWPTGSPRTHS
jgi:hypothetical protein